MALNPVDLKIELFLNDARNNLFLEDTTGLYSANNTGGYGLPGGATVNSVTTVTVTLNYTQLDEDLIYVFTVANGVITGVTSSFAGSTPVSIISEIPSTTWPFTSANRFELTADYGVTLPPLDDMVYACSYEIEGSYLAQSFDYTTEIQELYDVNTVCCLSKESVKVNILDPDSYTNLLASYGYLITAHSANENGNTDESNSYINRAKAICDKSNCGCGC